MITDLATGASHAPVASCATAFACLLRLSRQACSNGQGGAVCRGVVDGDTLPLSRLIEFAGELALKRSMPGVIGKVCRRSGSNTQYSFFSKILISLC